MTANVAQFEGNTSRLGREMELVLLRQFEGPTWGLGRALPRPTQEVEPSGGSTRRTPTCGSRWKLMPSVSLRSGGRMRIVELRSPPPTASTPCVGGLPTEPVREALQDVDTLPRLRPNRVGSRWWSALRLGEMNSTRKYTRQGKARRVFAMPQLAGKAAAARRATIALVRGGQRRRPMLHTPLAVSPGTTWS